MGEYCFCFRSSVNCRDAISPEHEARIRVTYTLTTAQGLLGSSVQVGAELGKGSDLTVLGQEELERTSNLLHGLELSGGADTRHGQTDVDRRSDTLEEELGLQEDLAVGDGNDVGGNVGRDITCEILGSDQWSGKDKNTYLLASQ